MWVNLWAGNEYKGLGASECLFILKIIKLKAGLPGHF